VFLGGFKAGKDNVHPASYSNLRGSTAAVAVAPAKKAAVPASKAQAVVPTSKSNATAQSQPQAHIYSGQTSATPAAGTTNSSNGSWDIDAIVATALKRAKKESTKKCAEYVRIALKAGDTNNKIKGGLGDAWQYDNNLIKLGWTPIGNILTCRPQKGDICVFPRYNHLVKKGGQYGHVCIYTGSQWVSDFVQATMYPSARNNTLPHTIYRASGAVDNGGSFAGCTPL
jgi:hypothetical protein